MTLPLILTILIIELLLLYLFSRRISKAIYAIFYLTTRSKRLAGALLTGVLLPGTVIHEFAHLLTAEILRVPTGKLSFEPQEQGDSIRAGSVSIAKTDPFRRYLIGFAPIIWGLATLALLIYMSFSYIPPVVYLKLRLALWCAAGYLLFAVSNSMFSSPKDLEGFAVFAPVLILLVAIPYFLGFRINLTPWLIVNMSMIIERLTLILGYVMIINTAILLSAMGILRLWKKVFREEIKL